MVEISKQDVLQQLRKVKGPDLSDNIVDLGLISEIVVAGSAVFFSLTVPGERAEELEPLRIAAEKAALRAEGVEKATVALTATKNADEPSGPVRPAPSAAQSGMVPPPMAARAAPDTTPPSPVKSGVPGIDAIIAVASGKGGVGKSTTAVNLALGLQAKGLKVGVLDADIYGPSIPRLLHISGRPQSVTGRILKPMGGYGLKVMSMGFLVDEETPMIWRGPMVISALTQMLREVEWGELDVLVVDMPPGTGDAQLTMAQNVPLSGAIIVSTPQDLALIDARKGLAMFRKVDVPILGVIENMSYFVCPDCGGRHDVFGHGGARTEAERIGVPFLGEVPLDIQIRETSDGGTPVVVTSPDSVHAKVYREIADRAWSRIGEERQMAGVPEIIFE